MLLDSAIEELREQLNYVDEISAELGAEQTFNFDWLVYQAKLAQIYHYCTTIVVTKAIRECYIQHATATLPETLRNWQERYFNVGDTVQIYNVVKEGIMLCQYGNEYCPCPLELFLTQLGYTKE